MIDTKTNKTSGNPERPYVSVVTPVWNAGATVRRTLEMMRLQQASFEHVVYDGRSADNTAQIVREFESAYPLRLVEGPNEGVYGNVANGHLTTQGEVMGWINGDDFYLPFTLAMVERVFRTRPDVNWLTGVPTLHWEGKNLWSLPGFYPVYPRTLIRRGLYRSKRLGCLQQESMFWRRSLYDAARGDEVLRHYKYAADFHLWKRFAEHSQLHTIGAVLAAFTFRDGQFSAANKSEYDLECGTTRGTLDLSIAGHVFTRLYSRVMVRSALRPLKFARAGHW
jgi:glycosyltransferase involved in cell wall biosynthesis